MRLFASERVVKTLDKLGFKEGDMIESKMVSRSIENAQKRVEENNFGIRKRLVEYDDVMNAQRKGVYGRRQNALKGERIGTDIVNMVYELAGEIVDVYHGDYDAMSEEVLKTFAMEPPFCREDFAKLDRNSLADAIAEAAMQTMNRNKEKMREKALPWIRHFVDEQGAKGLVGIPMTDGRRSIYLRTDLETAYETGCKSLTKDWEKTVLLTAIDKAWQEQLREMDELRKSVQNASYEQKDPLVIYKLEAYELWKKMLAEMNSKSIATLMRGKLAVPDFAEAQAAAEAKKAEAAAQQQQTRQQQLQGQMRREYSGYSSTSAYANYSTTRDSYEAQAAAQRKAAAQAGRRTGAPVQPVKAEPKIGRNDPCPCGSGKKYKNCHGKGL